MLGNRKWKCPETTCNDNYIGEAKQRIFERVNDPNGRDFNSHVLKHALENNHQHVSEKDFKIIGNGFRGNNKKRKVAEANSEHSRSVGSITII